MVYNTPISPELFFPLAFIFSILGIFGFLWLLFFLENSRDLSNRERVFGLITRLLFFAFCSSVGLLFWNLVGLW